MAITGIPTLPVTSSTRVLHESGAYIVNGPLVTLWVTGVLQGWWTP